jgi:hypothetical protein
MGLAILLELGHASELDFAKALRPLAAFGLIHGSHEWFEMFLLINAGMNPDYQPPNQVDILRLIMLTASFMFLVAFGAKLIMGNTQRRTFWLVMLASVIIWLIGLAWVFSTQSEEIRRMISADVYTRYSLAIPGAALTAWGLLIQRRRFIQAGMYSIGRDVALESSASSLPLLAVFSLRNTSMQSNLSIGSVSRCKSFGQPWPVWQQCSSSVLCVPSRSKTSVRSMHCGRANWLSGSAWMS